MDKSYWESFWSRQSDAFRLSLATSMGCLAAAGALALLGRDAAALGSAQGMACIGGFYFLLALAGARWRRRAEMFYPMPLALQERAAFATGSGRYRAAGGDWEHN